MYLKKMYDTLKKHAKDVAKSIGIGLTTYYIVPPLHEEIHAFTTIGGGGKVKEVVLVGKEYALLKPLEQITNGRLQLITENPKDYVGGVDIVPNGWPETIPKHELTNTAVMNAHCFLINILPDMLIGTTGLYYLIKGVLDKDIKKIGLGIAAYTYSTNMFYPDSDGTNAVYALVDAYRNGASIDKINQSLAESGISNETITTMQIGLGAGIIALQLGITYGLIKRSERSKSIDDFMCKFAEKVKKGSFEHKIEIKKKFLSNEHYVSKLEIKKGDEIIDIENTFSGLFVNRKKIESKKICKLEALVA